MSARRRVVLAVAVLLAASFARPAAGAPGGGGAAAPPRAVAVTVDDLPYAPKDVPLAEVEAGTRALLDAFAAFSVPAIGFVNEDRLLVRGEIDARVEVLDAWLDARLALGNHGFGHLGFQGTPFEDYRAALLQGEVFTRWLLAARGERPRFYRHPYTQTGPDAEAKRAFAEVLAERGYTVAPFTVENADWLIDRVHRAAVAAGDETLAERVRTAYVRHTLALFRYFEGLSREMFDREIPQVLLLHANDLNARTLTLLLAAVRARGYDFVPLAAALEDPAYDSPDGYVGPWGPSWFHRWLAGRGEPMRLADEPEIPEWVMERYRNE